VIGVGLTWGAVWAVIGAVTGVIASIVAPEVIDPGETPGRIALVLCTAGFISASGFALVLATLERGRSLSDLSLVRVALWGAAGSAVIPLLTAVADSMVVFTCPLGAVLAAGSVAIARRTELPRRHPSSLELEAGS
jgi:hypothetical protein